MATYELEPNNSMYSATTVSSGSSVTGQLSSESDRDYYAITAAGGGSIEVDLDSSSYSGRRTVSILNSSGQELASINASGDDSIGAGISSGGVYYVLVEDTDDYYGQY